MLQFTKCIWVCLLGMVMTFQLSAQGSCPVNIGFENGNFTNWFCQDGFVNANGVISFTQSQPINGKHTLLKNVAPQARDTFGGFPVNCPNGSGYSIKLGNGGAGAEAQGVSYTFTIPAGQDDYSIIYNYAVVLQNPADHAWFEQPQFTSKVFDVSANKYLECGSFQFIAAPNLPGFKESPVEPNIFYKDWAPVTIKLSGYAGKTIRLEFAVNDCTKKVHFGYAYLDVDENCTTPITGNTYCKGTGAVVLKAPYGFKEYSWFDGNDQLVGKGNTLTLNPPPPGNTPYSLQIVPFPGQGCQDTLHTTVISSNDFMQLKTIDTVTACSVPGADLTLPYITAGSTPGLQLQYFTDINETSFIDNAAAVTRSGQYYIKATGASGCTETNAINVRINPPPLVVTNTPAPVCAPGSVDLTNPAITLGSSAGLSFSYWQDSLATLLLNDPAQVNKSGRYFIKGTQDNGCYSVTPVTVTIGPAPVIVIKDLVSCGNLVLTSAQPTSGSDPGVQFSYWLDAAATQVLPGSQIFTTSSVFYVKAKALSGCELVKPVAVTIHPVPAFTVNDPPPTTRPATVDLSTTVQANSNWTYSYWKDTLATQALLNPFTLALSGRYFIKATNSFGCSATRSVNVQIIDPPVIPPNAFSPNNDGIHDTWQIPILNYYPDCIVEIFHRSGQSLYRSSGYGQAWDGRYKGRPLAAGTYYYLIWLAPGRTPISGSVTLLH